MAYSDFSLKKVKKELGIKIVENISLFGDVGETDISEYLIKTLERNVPLALSINTEKARSELIIINILLEVKDNMDQKISLFSGIEFSVDRERGLNGFCDYILSGSAEQLYLDIPIITIVEAKNENIILGLGQCIAEMYAAQLYNKNENHNLPSIYGVVTSGAEWKFIKLTENIAYIDKEVYYMNDVKKIIRIFLDMIGKEKICAECRL